MRNRNRGFSMTHQRKDTIVFNSEEFVLLDTEDDKLIYDSFKEINEPVEKYRLPPFDVNTALHRGHNERYEIRDNQLWGQMIKRDLIIDKPNKRWYETTEYSELLPIPYTGSCVIGERSYSDDWLKGYLAGDRAYELHFTSGELDECRDLRYGIEFYKQIFLKSMFYIESDDLRELHLKYNDAIAFHYLKYKYHPTHSMYWRYPENSISQVSEENREKGRKKLEENYQELLSKINRLSNMTTVYRIRDRYFIPEKGMAYSIAPNSKILKKGDTVYDLHGNCFVVKEMPVSQLHMCSFFLMDDFDYILESKSGMDVQGDILVDGELISY